MEVSGISRRSLAISIHRNVEYADTGWRSRGHDGHISFLRRHLERIDAKLVNIVHDEIVLEVAKQGTERAKEAVEKAMLKGMLAMFPNVSTAGLIEAKSAENWAEAK